MPTDANGVVPPPVLTATADQTIRSVELLAQSQDGFTAAQISIRRITTGYPTVVVRGANAANATSGTLFLLDQESPLGLTSYYQGKAHYSDGTSSDWSTAVAVSIGCDANEVWIKDVGQHERSRRFVLRELGGRRREARRELHRVRGRKRLVAISDVRGGAEEVAVFGTSTDAERQDLDILVDTGQTLLLQTPPDWGRRDSFQSFGNMQEVRLRQYGPEHHRNWQVELTEVDDPGSDRTGVPGATYGEVDTEFSSYASVSQARPTYLSVLAGTDRVQ